MAVAKWRKARSPSRPPASDIGNPRGIGANPESFVPSFHIFQELGDHMDQHISLRNPFIFGNII